MPYIKSYFLITFFIFSLNLYVFLTYNDQVSEDMIHMFNAYFIGKAFILIANLSLPFKSFHYNRIIFETIIGLIIGLLIFFLFMKLYQESMLVILDCGLCLLSVFSLMKMHHTKNARANHL